MQTLEQLPKARVNMRPVADRMRVNNLNGDKDNPLMSPKAGAVASFLIRRGGYRMLRYTHICKLARHKYPNASVIASWMLQGTLD